MNKIQPHGWDPRSPAVLRDQIAAYDELRGRCPVAHSDFLGWSILRHDDVVRVLDDPEKFSNALPHRLTVPNGMDQPEHTEFRRIHDRYFTPDLMDALEPSCRQIAAHLVDGLTRRVPIDLMPALAEIFALRVQNAFLGWPAELEEPLRRWTAKNRAATLAQDRPAMAAIAVEFDGFIRDLLSARRHAGDAAPDDLTTRLLGERVWDRPMTDDELVSLLRNWTVGELSTISASVGILAHYLATHSSIQQLLRDDPTLIGAANDEILRLHAPLIANRRVTTQPVEVGGQLIGAGERVTVLWASANRDEHVFGDPDEFRLDRDPADNLLYGRGIHACPGAPLSRLELRVLIEELLARSTELTQADVAPTRAHYPGSGFATLPLMLR
ncbi:cytochrome P450 [Cryobacterium sp. Y11]|uniref:cytochrome P450 n=1 Tax=Cryobacterium sp. Y11 TaxID=2045016 RepID=UPI000CE32C3E|nr:cytochrome P450 [Cryobacterium sp. Y11]